MRFISPLVSDARGRLGGVTGTRGAAAPFLRKVVRATATKTKTQTTARWNFTHCGQAWRSLSPAQIRLWNTYAETITLHNSLGVPHQPSGFNTFMRLALVCRSIGRALPTVPPTSHAPLPSLAGGSISATVSGSTMSSLLCTVPGIPVAARYAGIFCSSPTLGNGISAFPARRMRIIMHSYLPLSGSTNLTISYRNIIGAAHKPSSIWVTVQIFDIVTGNLGEPFTYKTITA